MVSSGIYFEDGGQNIFDIDPNKEIYEQFSRLFRSPNSSSLRIASRNENSQNGEIDRRNVDVSAQQHPGFLVLPIILVICSQQKVLKITIDSFSIFSERILGANYE